MDLRKERILLTGGNGFLGRHILEKLWNCGCEDAFTFGSKEFDLRKADEVANVYRCFKPTIVIHAAAHAGGIGLNQQKPGELFFDNISMGINVIHQAMLSKVKKITVIGTVCGYPKFAPTPFEEKSFWDGYPESTNAPYGIAKKALLVQAQAYRQQYGLNAVYLIPVNLYGPRDHFHLQFGHVVPTMIKRFTEAKADNSPSVTLWGTGNASREFLYVEDAAEAVVLATERYNKPEPVNIGTGSEIKIRDLAKLVADQIGYTGDILYNASKPDGQPSRCLDTERASQEFGFRAQTDFRDGLLKTIQWYQQQ